MESKVSLSPSALVDRLDSSHDRGHAISVASNEKTERRNSSTHVASEGDRILDASPPDMRDEAPSQYYPFSLIAIGAWVAFVALTLWLLEKAVHLENHFEVVTYHDNSATAYYDVSGVFLTGFTQFHGAMTATYLARLAVGSLQYKEVSPLSWAEVFWLAGRNWQGPFGLWSMWKDRKALASDTEPGDQAGPAPLRTPVGLSSTFIIFAIIALDTLITPILLSRAYPATPLPVILEGVRNYTTFTPNGLAAVEDVAQWTTGQGGWMTGRDVEQIYRDSGYFGAAPPSGSSGAPPSGSPGRDFFIAGYSDDGSTDVRLDGVHVFAQCAQIHPSSDLNSVQNAGQFQTWCNDHGYGSWSDLATFGLDVVGVTIIWCIALPNNSIIISNPTSNVSSSGIVWVGADDTTAGEAGFIQCNSTITVVSAMVYEPLALYSQLESTTMSASIQQASNPAIDPLYATFLTLSTDQLNYLYEFTGNETDIGLLQGPAVLDMLGYTTSYNQELHHYVYSQQPSLSDMALRIESGVAHMGAAIGVLAQQPVAQRRRVSVETFVTSRKRVVPFLVVSGVLIILWLVLLAYCTARMYRRSLGSTLDGFAAARIFERHGPRLVGHHERLGNVGDHRELAEPF